MPDIPDRGSGPYLDGKPLTPERLQQQITNADWPERDKTGPHARNIREQPGSNWRPCEVRLQFERDGEVWLQGTASRWTNSHVFVQGINDPRVARPGVWVPARDVRPIAPGANAGEVPADDADA